MAFVLRMGASAFANPHPPQRIVSICLPGDQYLLELVPRERILAVSPFAADPDLSVHWEQARGLPVTHGDAEELLRLKPDLVLASSFTPRLVVAALQRFGVPVLELDVPNHFDALRAQIRLAGQALGEAARAEEIVRVMDARLEQLRAHCPPPEKRPTALFYFHDGFVPGANTFENALLEIAGFRNLGHTGFSASLETVLMARPRLLVLTRYREESPTSNQYVATQMLFRKLGGLTAIVSVPFRHLAAPDPSNLELAELLQKHLSLP